MSDRRFGILMAWLIPLIFTTVGPYSVNDLANWTAHGLWFLDHGELLRRDPFSVLPTEPLVYPAWAVSIVYALLYRAGGLTLVCLSHAAWLAILLWILYRSSLLALEEPFSRRARLATYAFWLGSAAAFGERPSLVALIPLALAFTVLNRVTSLSRLDSRRLALLCAIELAWVNLHGSFILLWLMFAWKTSWLAFAERGAPAAARRQGIARLAAGHACLGVAALANPFGWKVFPYLLETMRLSRGRMISEWEPTTPLSHFPTGALYFAVLAGSLLLLARGFRKPGFWATLSSPFFLLLLNGATAIRNAALPLVVLLPAMTDFGLLGERLSPAPATPSPATPATPATPARRRAANALVAAIFVATLVLVSPPLKPRVAWLLPPHRREVFDHTAVYRIAEGIRQSHRGCAIFNSWEIGSFLMLELPNRIFVDGRNIVYREEELSRYLEATRARPGWEDYLERHGACLAVLDPRVDAPLIGALRERPDWRLLVEEKGMLLFGKAGPSDQPMRRIRSGSSGSLGRPEPSGLSRSR